MKNRFVHISSNICPTTVQSAFAFGWLKLWYVKTWQKKQFRGFDWFALQLWSSNFQDLMFYESKWQLKSPVSIFKVTTHEIKRNTKI